MSNTQMRGEDAARAYWAAQLDEAHQFMTRVMEFPVEECGEPLVDLREAVAAAGVRVTFSTSKIAGQLARVFMLREKLIPSFVAVARAMNDRGWIMEVEDGYRTREMQRSLSLAPYVLDIVLAKVAWELAGATPESELFFKRLSVLTATAPKIGTHMSGSAIDISVHAAESGREVDRGGPYIELSEKTPMRSPFISPEAAVNRAEITDFLTREGFVAYPYEFWHYNQGDAYHTLLTGSDEPARYGAVDVDPATGRVTPIEEPTRSLHAPDAFRAAMNEALTRIGRG